MEAGTRGVIVAKECLLDDGSLVLAADNDKDLLSRHDGADTHGVSLTRNLIDGSEEALVCLDGALLQIYAVGALCEDIGRLVEADVAVMTHAQQLEINAAQLSNDAVVILRKPFSASGSSPSGMCRLSKLMLM